MADNFSFKPVSRTQLHCSQSEVRRMLFFLPSQGQFAIISGEQSDKSELEGAAT